MRRYQEHLRLSAQLSVAHLPKTSAKAMGSLEQAISVSDWDARQDERVASAKAACAARRERRAARERGDQ